MIPFLALEHAGKLTPKTEHPPRLARVLYDVVALDKSLDFCDSVVNLTTGKELEFEVVDKKFHSPLNAYDFFPNQLEMIIANNLPVTKSKSSQKSQLPHQCSKMLSLSSTYLQTLIS